MVSFGKTLRRWREEKGWSQDQLAEFVGVKSGKQTISRWELEKVEPSLSELRKVAGLFDKTVSELLGEQKIIYVNEERPGYMYVSIEEFTQLQRQVIDLQKEKLKPS